jgi:hypothetical protein
LLVGQRVPPESLLQYNDHAGHPGVVLELEKGFRAGRRHYVAAAVVGCMAVLRPAHPPPIGCLEAQILCGG